MANRYVSLLSELYHFLTYSSKSPKAQLQTGVFIISIDIDVGDKKLGIVNRGKNDVNVSKNMSEYEVGKIEEQALPLFIELFDNLEIPVTFALRGQLVEVNHLIFELLLRKSSVKHDIGAHGYYHRSFRNLSQKEAENELNMISAGMKKFSVAPRSFAFPENRVAHLNLLEKFGYRCYRGAGAFGKDCMRIEKQGRLYNIHPSLYLGQSSSTILLKKILDVAVAKKAPLHFWFHLWNFGESNASIKKYISNVFFPLLNYAKKKERSGVLAFETMLSVAERIEIMQGN